ncbi:MAG: PIN domain-containing protein [Acidobacteria bacterium]|nr:MAG: PIN domain-containing protein [Acidobacteriota bacterium]
MRFWDASALSPLIVTDVFTARAEALMHQDEGMMVWWGSRVECASSLARREREGRLAAAESEASWRRLERMVVTWNEVAPNDDLRAESVRLLRRHSLRAADALQLAAAVLAAKTRPQPLDFVTFDERLADAAREEGFRIQGIR